MKRVLLHCVGSAGDVLPFIAIARALQARGAAPAIATSAWFAPLIEQAGVTAIALGSREDYLAAVHRPGLWHPWRGPRALWSIVMDQLPRAVLALDDWLADPDAILVGSTLALAVRIAAERGHPDTATVHLSPACLLSAERPPRLPGLPRLDALPRWLRRQAMDLVERAAWHALAPDLQSARAAANLPPLASPLTAWMHSPHRVVAAFPEWFAPAAGDWPARTVQAGFPQWRSDATLSPELEAFLDDGDPPVVITGGTGYAQAGPFLASGLDAATSAGARAVLVCAFRDALPPLPAGRALAVGHAPFPALLPRASAVVHHGGIGTTAAAFAAGVPQCISPLAFDQFDNAARVVALGAGVELPRPGRDAARWARGVERALRDARLRAAADACGVRMRTGGSSASDIADILLAGYDRSP
jgi:rhamnosyltransferase subunit B